MSTWTVIYDDPKQTAKARYWSAHTLHRTGCADIERSREAGGNPVELQATDLVDALVEAQYQGSPQNDGNDLGYAATAPCVHR